MGQKFQINILQWGHKDEQKINIFETREGESQLQLEQKFAVEVQDCVQVPKQKLQEVVKDKKCLRSQNEGQNL